MRPIQVFRFEVPSEIEMARAYLAQLDPNSVSADEYAEAVLMATREVVTRKGFGFPEVEPEELPDE